MPFLQNKAVIQIIYSRIFIFHLGILERNVVLINPIIMFVWIMKTSAGSAFSGHIVFATQRDEPLSGGSYFFSRGNFLQRKHVFRMHAHPWSFKILHLCNINNIYTLDKDTTYHYVSIVRDIKDSIFYGGYLCIRKNMHFRISLDILRCVSQTLNTK